MSPTRPFTPTSSQLRPLRDRTSPPQGRLVPPQHRKSVWRRRRVTVATRGSRPVDSACSSMLDAAIRVVISASAATPAPQQLRAKGVSVWAGPGCVGPGCERGGGGAVLAWGNRVREFSLDFGRDEMDLLAVLVRYYRIVSGPRIRAQDNSVLEGGESVDSVPADPRPPM